MTTPRVSGGALPKRKVVVETFRGRGSTGAPSSQITIVRRLEARGTVSL
jgi:hypothetical protein